MRSLVCFAAANAAAWPRCAQVGAALQPLHQRPPSLRCRSVLKSLRKAFSCSSAVDLTFPSLAEVDQKWQKIWQMPAQWTPKTTSKGKYYVLPMFPYPSGALHIGHLRVYTISDVLARYRRMCGHDVLHTIGWDAFGLPAENAAIERGIDPEKWTRDNIASMRKQIISMGGCWDWNQELTTCDPSFYKDTQKLFLRLYEAGLAYQSEAEVNYDPIDRTVLANEQVDSNGLSWRSGARVEKRSLKQWFLKITAYKDALLDDIAIMEKSRSWPQNVLNMQKNWLGRSQGANIRFDISSSFESPISEVDIFTTRPDTLFGVQYLALSLDHPLVLEAAKHSSDLQGFLEENKTNFSQDANPTAGYLLDNIVATNPLSSLPDAPDCVKQAVPVYAASYVLGGYGTGAVMGVPAHDARDFTFWQRHCPDEPPRQVVSPLGSPKPHLNSADSEHGILNSQCGSFANLASQEGGAAIVQALAALGNGSAKMATQWRLRDWLISRQRYWGTPIPIIHCDSCGPQPVPHFDLPVQLPRLSEQQLKNSQGNPLASIREWLNTVCPSCRSPARRETDTMDTFVDSSWYYLRFAQGALEPAANQQSQANHTRGYMPVDIYVGGVEHAILHLLYARFIHKFLQSNSAAASDMDSSPEPFQRLLAQGMVHGPTYTDASTNRIVKPSDVDGSNPAKLLTKGGSSVKVRWEKMSKSKHNGVDPMVCLAKYGADATRAHLLFSAPVEDILEWDEAKIVGVQRWFGRVWTLVTHPHVVCSSHNERSSRASEPSATAKAPRMNLQSAHDIELWETVQKTVQSVNQSFSETYSLNTVVSDLMQLTNTLLRHLKSLSNSSSECVQVGKEVEGDKVLYEGASALVRMMSPISPSFAEEAWIALHDGKPTSRAFETSFPDAAAAQFRSEGSRVAVRQERKVVCAVQVNGKLKFTTTLRLGPAVSPSAPASSSSALVGSAAADGAKADVVTAAKEEPEKRSEPAAAAAAATAAAAQQQRKSEAAEREKAEITEQILTSVEAQGILFRSSSRSSSRSSLPTSSASSTSSTTSGSKTTTSSAPSGCNNTSLGSDSSSSSPAETDLATALAAATAAPGTGGPPARGEAKVKAKWDVEHAKRIIVVQGGRTVNFVF